MFPPPESSRSSLRRPVGRLFAGLALASACLAGSRADAQTTPGEAGVELHERAPLRYSRREPTDVVARWRESLAGGQPALDLSSERALLRSVLAELGVPEETQTLVFSRTSLQSRLISPATPRALYFSDDVYVGWMPGGSLELITTDRVLGLVFYEMKTPFGSPRLEKPVVTRDRGCLVCHAGAPENPFPGLRAFSVFANDEGVQVLRGVSLDVDHRTPLRERWGGWYVTGRVEGPRHRGNLFAVGRGGPAEIRAEDRDLGRLTTLAGVFDTRPYLRERSDVAALLVLEHQIAAHNRLMAAHGRARLALYHDDQRMAGGEPVEATRRVLAAEAEGLLEVFLFKDEASLAEHRVAADPDFARVFAAGARRDALGRSLRDLRLDGRVFEYRCSPLIHSLAFARLPEELRAVFFARLGRVLREPAGTGAYPWLGDEERAAIREIVTATVPLAPPGWDAP